MQLWTATEPRVAMWKGWYSMPCYHQTGASLNMDGPIVSVKQSCGMLATSLWRIFLSWLDNITICDESGLPKNKVPVSHITAWLTKYVVSCDCIYVVMPSCVSKPVKRCQVAAVKPAVTDRYTLGQGQFASLFLAYCCCGCAWHYPEVTIPFKGDHLDNTCYCFGDRRTMT